MEPKEYEIKVALQILKPATEIFEAIVDPERMSGYFLKQGSARMEENTRVMWEFPEFEGAFAIDVKSVIPHKYISFTWEVDAALYLVEMSLQQHTPLSTVLAITERPEDPSLKDLKWLKGNTEGWANFLACLKANLEYHINLRKGAFDFRFKA